MKNSNDKWFLRKRRVTPEKFLRILPFIFLFPILAFVVSLFVEPRNEIHLEVARGGRVIALEYADEPKNRLVFVSPVEYRMADGNVDSRAAIASYGPIDSKAANTRDYTRTELTVEQWEIVNNWRSDICRNKTLATQDDATFQKYRIAIQCGNQSYGRVYLIERGEINPKVINIIDVVSRRDLQ